MVLEESDVITEDLITFLEGSELGTNGAKYTHLDLRKRICDVDCPTSFSLKRNQRIIANVTFCVRDFAFYVRYFAFHPRFQSDSRSQRKRNVRSGLEQSIEGVFKKLEDQKELPFYAYVDADNSRSQHMSSRFGFSPYTGIVSRTFSRLQTKKMSEISLEYKRSPKLIRVFELKIPNKQSKSLFFPSCFICLIRSSSSRLPFSFGCQFGLTTF